MFGERFYQLVYLYLIENQADFEFDQDLPSEQYEANSKLLKSRQSRFKKNEKRIKSSSGFQIILPDSKTFSTHVREIFELFKHTFSADEIKALWGGTLFSEKFLNLYFKILEKMNLVLLSAQEFQKQTPTDAVNDTIPSVEKVMYCQGNFMRKLRKANKAGIGSNP